MANGGITPPGMQKSNYKPTWGQGNRFTSIVKGAIDREQQLEVLSANLKSQKELNDAVIKSRERIVSEQEGTKARGQDFGLKGIDRQIAGRETVAGTQIDAELDKTNLNIDAQKEIVDKRIDSAEKIASLKETGLDRRQAGELANRIDLRNMDHISAKNLLEKELASRMDISQLKEAGMLDRLTMQLQNQTAIVQLQEDGRLDRLLEQIASTEGIAGADRNTRLQIIDKQIAGDKDIQKYIQSNLNKRQLKDLGHKSFMEQYIQGKLDSRLNAKIASEENIRQMMIDAESDLSLQDFNQRVQLQLNDYGNKFLLQDDRQEFLATESELEFKRRGALDKASKERQLISDILKMKQSAKFSKQEQLDQTAFVASPFQLHDKTGILGLNYKEDQVLDQVETNLTTLSQVTNILRNAPREEVGWFGKNIMGETGLDPRVKALSGVLKSYEKELSEGPFYSALDDKDRARTALKDVRGLLDLLDTPSTSYDNTEWGSQQ